MGDARNYSGTIATRLASRLMKTESGCHEFMGARNRTGYGRISRGGKGAGYEGAHRVAWMLRNGAIPDGMAILHRCDNPPCCNPDHLFLGTQADNVADMWSKHRQAGQLAAGVGHPSARLTDDQVADIRSMASQVGNYAELGRLYGISKQHARALVLGHSRG